MRLGTVFQSFGESCLVAAIGYAQFGWIGPAIVIGLYAIGSIINFKTEGRKVIP